MSKKNIAIINFSPGSSVRPLEVNSNKYISWSSAGFQDQIIAFPLPTKTNILKLNVHVTFIEPQLPTGTLLSIIDLANDCQNIFYETQLKAINNANTPCSENETLVKLSKGDQIGLRVRYNTGPGEDQLTNIRLIYNATIELAKENNKHSLGTIIPYTNGSPNTLANSTPIINNPFYLAFGGGHHRDPLFWIAPENGTIKHLSTATTFYTKSLQPGQTLTFTIQKATGCLGTFSDTELTTTIIPHSSTTLPLVICSNTTNNLSVPISKGDRIALKVTFNSQIPDQINNVIIGAGLQYCPLKNSQFSVIRYTTNPTTLIPNLIGTIESGTTIHYPLSSDTSIPSISYWVAPRDGCLSNLHFAYLFANNSPIKTIGLNDSISATILIANRCDFNSFKPTKLSCKLKHDEFCCDDSRPDVEVKHGDRVALQILWTSSQSHTQNPIVLLRGSVLFE